MAYKDKDRQRQAVREATRRYRSRKQGITPKPISVTPVIPSKPEPVIPKPQSYNRMMVGYVPPKG